jgi:hypothetical protein
VLLNAIMVRVEWQQEGGRASRGGGGGGWEGPAPPPPPPPPPDAWCSLGLESKAGLTRPGCIACQAGTMAEWQAHPTNTVQCYNSVIS